MTLQCTCLHTYCAFGIAACDQLYPMVGVLDPLPYWYTLKLLTLTSCTHLFTSRTFLVMLSDALLAGYTRMNAFSILQDVYAMIQ